MVNILTVKTSEIKWNGFALMSMKNVAGLKRGQLNRNSMCKALCDICAEQGGEARFAWASLQCVYSPCLRARANGHFKKTCASA